MLVLALDTATPRVSVALLDDAGPAEGRTVRVEAARDAAQRHGAVLAPLVADVLAGLGDGSVPDLVVCGVGPGPFTGLRVGIVTARVLADVWGRPVVGICSLDALAAAVVREGLGGNAFLVATDARRREVYWARYDEGGRRVEGPFVGAPAALAQRHPSVPVFGEGAVRHAAVLAPTAGPASPPAIELAQLALAALVGGAVLPAPGSGVAEPDVDAASGDGSGSGRVPAGTLLAPAPLYLRRPDAVANPAAVGGPA